METMLDELYYEGPKIYSPKELSEEPDLFRNRTALFYTPTENMPAELVGEGKLEITLPVAFPTLFEWNEILAYRIPRLWVDLIQRATGKLRWIPMVPAKVTLIRYDSTDYGVINVNGAKALLDALKHQTTGRHDSMMLHYFGAIRDDNCIDLKGVCIKQILVDHPSKAYTRLIVEQA